MFDVMERIEDGYLWNFSFAEKILFKAEHRKRQSQMQRYQTKLMTMVVQEETGIFADDEPHPSTPFEIKYTFNRLYMNDPRETELCLGKNDPPADKRESYAQKIVWAFKDNTYCDTVILNGVRTLDGWKTRGFNDEEAGYVLNVLADKKLSELTFAHYPLLTDVTYLKIANTLMKPDNRWAHVTLGPIAVAGDIAATLAKTGKVAFKRLQGSASRKSLLSYFFQRERDS